MNPSIPADYPEIGRWLAGFVRAHAKREDARIEVAVDDSGEREGRSFGVRLVLDARLEPPVGVSPLEFEYHEVATGRTQFAWCSALAERVRTLARALLTAARAPA
jgi:hypothetical protein